MERLFTALTDIVSGHGPAALLAALVWGVLSIVLSPCHLASIPLVVGFIQGQGQPSPRRAAALATVFATGILATIAAIGVVTAGAGRLLGDLGAAGNVAAGAVFLFVGLVLLDVLPLPLPSARARGRRGQGLLAALLLGLVFGLALGPCTFAFMAPLLAVTFKAGGTDGWRGALMLVAYGVGHCAVIVAAGSSAAWAQKVLDWNAGSATGRRLKRVCGVLVLLGGLSLFWSAR